MTRPGPGPTRGLPLRVIVPILIGLLLLAALYRIVNEKWLVPAREADRRALFVSLAKRLEPMLTPPPPSPEDLLARGEEKWRQGLRAEALPLLLKAFAREEAGLYSIPIVWPSKDRALLALRRAAEDPVLPADDRDRLAAAFTKALSATPPAGHAVRSASVGLAHTLVKAGDPESATTLAGLLDLAGRADVAEDGELSFVLREAVGQNRLALARRRVRVGGVLFGLALLRHREEQGRFPPELEKVRPEIVPPLPLGGEWHIGMDHDEGLWALWVRGGGTTHGGISDPVFLFRLRP